MELHSYAKHRASKKFSIEQKRRLVEARINCDELFRLKPKTSLLPWKKVIVQAKLDDFNAVFVRKQWSNMVAKYMQYKQDRLGNKPTHDIDAETVGKITQEWEFFQPIHRYMTRKTTNLHSYALISQNKQEQQNEEHSPRSQENSNMKLTPPQQASTSSNERLNVCSSDTNEDFEIGMVSSKVLPNTDHDFYSKKAEQQCYFADVEEDTLESVPMDIETTTTTVINDIDNEHTQGFELNGSEVNVPNVVNQETVKTDIKQETQNINNNDKNIPTPISKSNGVKRASSFLTERDKYYRHKRRFNHRMECRFDAIMNIIGQFAKTQCPNIDISPIEKTGTYIKKGLLSSSSSSSSSSDEETNDANRGN